MSNQIHIEHVETLILLGERGPRLASKPARTFDAAREQRPGKCPVPGCPGWADSYRRGDVSVLECDICGTAIDPGMSPGDIEMQGRTYTGGKP